MNDEREARLATWARELIADLRKRVQYATEPLAAEVAKLRPQVALLKARNDALTELLECAAKGGHKAAWEIVQIIEGYDLTLTKRED
jgi:hypothetical protein